MNKLQRYSAVTKTGIETVCLDAYVSALEAELAELKAREQRLRELADRWMDEMKPTTTPVIHQSLICHEHALCIRAILNTPAASGGRT